MFSHKILFCKPKNKPDINNNSVISCSKCQPETGIWLYSDGFKFWIPNNKCKNICKLLKIPYQDLTEKCKKNPRYQKKIDKVDEKNILDYLVIKNTKCWYKLNRLDSINDDEIFCKLGDKIVVIPENKNTLGTLSKYNLLSNCEIDPDKCEADYYQNLLKQNRIKDIEPKDFYNIPIKNGTSHLTKPINFKGNIIHINGYQCQNCQLISLAFTIEKFVYLFNKDYVYKFFFEINNFYSSHIIAHYPKSIESEFIGIPSNLDSGFYWEEIQSIFFFKGKFYYKYNLKHNKLDYKREITETWKFLVKPIQSVVKIGDKISFFSEGLVYDYRITSYIRINDNYHIVFQLNYGYIHSWELAHKIANKCSGVLPSISTLIKNNKHADIYNIPIWTQDNSKITYQVKNINNKKNIYECKDNSCFSKGGVMVYTINKDFVPNSTFIKKQLISKINRKLYFSPDAIFYFNNSYWLFYNKYIYIYNANFLKKNKIRISKIFKELILPHKTKSIDLCYLERKYQNRKNYLYQKLIDSNKIQTSLEKSKNIKNNILTRSGVTFENQGKIIKSLSADISTRERHSLQQNVSLSRYNKIIVFLTILIIVLAIILLYMFYRYQFNSN